MTIEPVEIAVNRYAPAGSDAINLYSYDLASNLTLGQLVQAVCLRSAAAYESESVTKMNLMNTGTQKLDDAADWLKKIVNGSANWEAAKDFLVNKMGIEESALPSGIDTYDKRMQAAKALQDKMDTLTQSQQEDMIDLQTLVNRRDVAYSTSSSVVRTLGMSQNQDAQNFLG